MFDLDDAPVTRFERITRRDKKPKRPVRTYRAERPTLHPTRTPAELVSQIRVLARACGMRVNVVKSPLSQSHYVTLGERNGGNFRIRISDHPPRKQMNFLTVLCFDAKRVAELAAELRVR